MTEAEIAKKLRGLKEIKPRKDWVVLTKKEILGEESFGLTLFPYFKPAFAGLVAVCLLFGLFGFVKNALPGDLLYIVKRAAHYGQVLLIPEQEKPVYQLKLANDRLEDLTKAPVKNLAPTINEFQANIHEAAQNLARIDATTSDPVVMKKIVEETKKLDENKQKIESLGMEVGGTEELDTALAKIVGNLIEDLEGRTLTEEKENVLTEIKELIGGGKYTEALELYLINQ
jgi:hypothetical protein